MIRKENIFLKLSKLEEENESLRENESKLRHANGKLVKENIEKDLLVKIYQQLHSSSEREKEKHLQEINSLKARLKRKEKREK